MESFGANFTLLISLLMSDNNFRAFSTELVVRDSNFLKSAFAFDTSASIFKVDTLRFAFSISDNPFLIPDVSISALTLILLFFSIFLNTPLILFRFFIPRISKSTLICLSFFTKLSNFFWAASSSLVSTFVLTRTSYSLIF